MKEPWFNSINIRQAVLVMNSYQRWAGEKILDVQGSDEEAAKALFEAPFVVVSHDRAKDPILNYGNRAALNLWEMTWDSFIHTPSRLTAENIERSERARFLQAVIGKGMVRNYQGIRISSTGRRFRIEGAVLWNVLDEMGRHHGQAASFQKWTYL